MLNKEKLLTTLSMEGWREITVVSTSSTSESYGAMRDFLGNISDTELEGKDIYSILSRPSGHETLVEFGFEGSERLPQDTIYVKRKSMETLTLSVHWYGDYGFYRSDEAAIFTRSDVNKTIEVYVGVTPPP